MSKVWLVGALVVIGVILGAFATLFAQGAPTAPLAQLNEAINPAEAQALPIELNMGVYSVVAPNTVWGLGMHFSVTVVETTSAGKKYVLLNQQPEAPTIGTSSGGFYQLSNALSVTTVAACSGSGCAGATENISLTLQGVVVTPFVAWMSPVSYANFTQTSAVGAIAGGSSSTVPTTLKSVPTATAFQTYLLEVSAPLTLLVGIETLGAWVVGMKNPVLPVVGVAALVLVVIEFLLL